MEIMIMGEAVIILTDMEDLDVVEVEEDRVPLVLVAEVVDGTIRLLITIIAIAIAIAIAIIIVVVVPIIISPVTMVVEEIRIEHMGEVDMAVGLVEEVVVVVIREVELMINTIIQHNIQIIQIDLVEEEEMVVVLTNKAVVNMIYPFNTGVIILLIILVAIEVWNLKIIITAVIPENMVITGVEICMIINNNKYRKKLMMMITIWKIQA